MRAAARTDRTIPDLLSLADFSKKIGIAPRIAHQLAAAGLIRTVTTKSESFVSREYLDRITVSDQDIVNLFVAKGLRPLASEGNPTAHQPKVSDRHEQHSSNPER